MARWFTSDLHLGHGNIIGYCDRPFGDTDEMNAELIRRWNDTVGETDEVWVLGDVAMGPIREGLRLAGQLAGHKVLVTGNHDRCWDGHADRDRAKAWEDEYRSAGFADILHGAVRTDIRDDNGAIEVLCSHFPYVGDSHDDDRFASLRPIDDGHVILHGHVHTGWRVEGRQINVGVDSWDYRPVAEATLVALARRAALGVG